MADGYRVVGQIHAADVSERVRKGMGQYPIPVVLLKRLAVDISCHGTEIGEGLLRDAIERAWSMAEPAGVRALLTQPIDEAAARFYEGLGVVRSPTAGQFLQLLLKDARRLLEKCRAAGGLPVARRGPLAGPSGSWKAAAAGILDFHNGGTLNAVGFDDITFGSATPGGDGDVPEIDALSGTGALGLLGFALALAGQRRRPA